MLLRKMTRIITPIAPGAGGGGTGAFRSSEATSFNGTADIVANMPAGVQNGDYLLAYIAADGNPTITPPGGWTLIDNGTITAESNVWYLYGRVASSEPGTYTWTNPSSIDTTVIITAHQGINGTPRTFTQPTTSNTLNASPITLGAVGGTAVAHDCLVYFASLDKSANDAYTFAPPATFTEREDENAPGVWITTACFTKDDVSAGATGTINSTATLSAGSATAGWNTVVVALAAA